MYIQSRVARSDILKSFKIACYGTIFSSYLVITLVFAFMPVSSKVLEATGIYSNEKATFQVLKKDLIGVFRNVGLPVEDANGISVVTGYIRFNFGGVKLLCKAPFDPAIANAEARRKAVQDKRQDPALVAGDHCVPIQKGEVRKFRN
jgi:hypothetical protein